MRFPWRDLLVPTACLFSVVTLTAASCQHPVDPTPTAFGGSTGFGGASTGGYPATGGTSLAGAPAATGGASAGAPGVAGSAGASEVVVFPSKCDFARQSAPKVRPSLSGWKRSPKRAIRAREKARYANNSPSVFLRPNNPIALDQGSLGSCTGNMVAQSLSTWPFTSRFTEYDAVAIYSRATEIDPYKGVYPPDDTGSNGESAWRAAADLGHFNGSSVPLYSLEALQTALQKASCGLGTDWFSAMFTPTTSGELQIGGTIEGGHEVQIIGWDAKLKRVWIRNSWGPGWGVCRGEETGYAYFSAGTLQRLLNQGSEIDCPVMEQ